MAKQKVPNVWNFIEKYYPNYSSSDEIANNSDLFKLAHDEHQEGDSATKLLKDEYGGDIDNPRIEKDLIYSTECIYREAILNFLSLEKEKPKILIELKGGLIQQISANTQDIDICVADYDSEDWDDNAKGNETIQDSAWMRIKTLPEIVSEKIFKIFEKRKNLSKQETYVMEKLKKEDF